MIKLVGHWATIPTRIGMTLVDKILLCIHPVILEALNEISPQKIFPLFPLC